MSKHPIWIDEKTASAKMGHRDTKYFRGQVKSGVYAISYRFNQNNRRDYEYDLKDIESIKNQTAVLIY
jgi:hypothetical protein